MNNTGVLYFFSFVGVSITMASSSFQFNRSILSSIRPPTSLPSRQQFRCLPAPEYSETHKRWHFDPRHDAALKKVLECTPNAGAEEMKNALGWTDLPADKFKNKLSNFRTKMRKLATKKQEEKHDKEANDAKDEQEDEEEEEKKEKTKSEKIHSVLGKRSRESFSSGDFMDRFVTIIDIRDFVAVIYSPSAALALGTEVQVESSQKSIKISVMTSTLQHNTLAKVIQTAQEMNCPIFMHELNSSLQQCQSTEPIEDVREILPGQGKVFNRWEATKYDMKHKHFLDPPGNHPLDTVLYFWKRESHSTLEQQQEPQHVFTESTRSVLEKLQMKMRQDGTESTGASKVSEESREDSFGAMAPLLCVITDENSNLET